MSATGTKSNLDEVIRFRSAPDLKDRLARVARKRHLRPADFLRTRVYALVEAEEAAIAAEAKPKK